MIRQSTFLLLLCVIVHLIHHTVAQQTTTAPPTAANQSDNTTTVAPSNGTATQSPTNTPSPTPPTSTPTPPPTSSAAPTLPPTSAPTTAPTTAPSPRPTSDLSSPALAMTLELPGTLPSFDPPSFTSIISWALKIKREDVVIVNTMSTSLQSFNVTFRVKTSYPAAEYLAMGVLIDQSNPSVLTLRVIRYSITEYMGVDLGATVAPHDSGDGDGGIGTALLVGIILGCLVGAVCIGGCTYFLVKNGKQYFGERRLEKANEEYQQSRKVPASLAYLDEEARNELPEEAFRITENETKEGDEQQNQNPNDAARTETLDQPQSSKQAADSDVNMTSLEQQQQEPVPTAAAVPVEIKVEHPIVNEGDVTSPTQQPVAPESENNKLLSSPNAVSTGLGDDLRVSFESNSGEYDADGVFSPTSDASRNRKEHKKSKCTQCHGDWDSSDVCPVAERPHKQMHREYKALKKQQQLERQEARRRRAEEAQGNTS